MEGAESVTSAATGSCSTLGGLEGIAELLRCYICMEGLKDTTLCPHCCKLVCFSCVTRWISENKADCPHCRMALTVRELVKMPLFDSLVKVVEDLRSKQEDVNRLPNNDAQMCALFSGKHKEHSFQPLDKLHKKHKLALETELCKLRDRMRDILSFVLQVEKRVEVVRANKSKTRREMQQLVEKLYSKVDSRTKDKLSCLEECRRFLRSQALDVMKTAHNLERKMVSGSYWSLMNEEGELKQELRESLDKLYSHPLKMDALSTPQELTNELVPTYTTGLFKIEPFRELQRKGEEVYSDNLRLDGLTWRLKVYPNGHHEDVGRYLAVFMELSEGYEKVTSYQYCIEMLYNCSDKYSQKNYSRDYVSDFGDGECWGYKKYYQLSKLASDGFLKGDTLLLRFSVRQVSYHDKCTDISIYVKSVRDERNALREQLKETQNQISTLRAENKKLAARPRSTTNRERRISPRSSRGHHPAAATSYYASPHHDSTHYSMSASQTVLRSPRHNKASANYSEEQPAPSHHMLATRRRSHDATMNTRSMIEHRRRSVDPTLPFEHDSDSDHHLRLHTRTYCSQSTERPMFEESNSDHDHIGSQSLAIEDSAPEGMSKLSQADFNEEEPPEITVNAPTPLEYLPTPLEYLSQPSSPPKSRVGKSQPDIHAALSQQFPSQSIPEFSHYPGQWEGGSYYTMDAVRTEARWFHDGRFKRPIVKPNMSASQGQIYHMRSDPHLNFEAMAVKGSGLEKVTEEQEAGRRERHRSRSRGHQQLGKKHLQATVVTKVPKAESLRPEEKTGGSGLSSSAAKSNSTSSLNLSQIL